MKDLVIVESVAGTHYYHLAERDQRKALCEAFVMSTCLPLDCWGRRGHLGERYCRRCTELATQAVLHKAAQKV